LTKMPIIKREESPELPIASIAPELYLSTENSSYVSTEPTPSEEDDVKSSILSPVVTKPCSAARQTHLAPNLYRGVSPRTYTVGALGYAGDYANVHTPPAFLRLPSRLGPGMATGRVNKTTTVSTRLHRTKKTHLDNNNHIAQHFRHRGIATQNRGSRMDQDDSGNTGYTNGMDVPGFATMASDGQDESDVLVPRSQMEDLQYSIQWLLNAHRESEQKVVEEQAALILELVSFNARTHGIVEDLNERLKAVENEKIASGHDMRGTITAARTLQPAFTYRTKDARSRSPSPDGRDYRNRTRKPRKGLEIHIPGKTYVPPSLGLATPKSNPMGTFGHTPRTPLTPGRIGPPSGTKKTLTCINKRGIHNLDRMVPPTNALLPLLPLTDTEIIVYFFNALCRPIVSLRLYARGWGPAAINDALNSHRVIEPAYLRNTCSVKCTTAIKKGIEKYGEKWDVINRAVFQDKDMSDSRATDLIKLDDDEKAKATDFYLRDLCYGLRKHPGEHDGGIFTRCVKYCEENNASYKLSNVWKLATNLEAGRTPSGSTTPETSGPMEEDLSSHAQSEISEDSVIGQNTEASSQEAL
ncbi:hypothetical protein BDU57DRAFT_456953, partial [Ampelomyces quisqualis]